MIDAPLGRPNEPLVREYGLERSLQLSRPSRPKVDLIIIEPERLLLIELKIIRWLDGLSHLVAYKAMVPHTPELTKYNGSPINVRLVLPYTQENILMTAYALGVEVEVYTTPEIDHYVSVELPAYGQSAYRRRREERRRTLEALGLE